MIAVATVAAAPILAAIAIEDLRHHRIRNHYILALAVVTVSAVLVGAIKGDGAIVGHAVLGAVLGSAPLAAAWLSQPARVGGGDVKLAAALGAFVGGIEPWLALTATGLGLLASLVHALVSRRQSIPLAPAMIMAAVIVFGIYAAM